MKKAVILFLAVFSGSTLVRAQAAVPPAGGGSVSTSVSAPAAASTAAAAGYEVAPDTRTLVEKLRDGNSLVRRNAVIMLGTERKAGNIGYFESALKDSDPAVRRVAVNALLQVEGSKDTPARVSRILLKQMDGDPDPGVRLECVKAFGRLKSKEAEPKLQALLKDNNPMIRTFAVSSLDDIGDPAYYPDIAAMLLDTAESVKVQAARAVIRHRIRAAVPNLVKNLSHPVGKVRGSMAEALGEIAGPDVLPSLEPLLADRDNAVKEQAQAAVNKIKQRAPAQQ